MNQESTGPRVGGVPAINAGPLEGPGHGYPDAPYSNDPVVHEQQGMVVMSRCVNCGLAVKPEELGTHTMEEGFASDFGKREWTI